jgi:hypothetical protein
LLCVSGDHSVFPLPSKNVVREGKNQLSGQR